MYETNLYRAEVIRWVDGDTVWLRVDLGQRTQREDSYRLARIDAPEVIRHAGVSEEEVAAGKTLTALLDTRYPPGTIVSVKTKKDPGKYGRYLVTLFVNETLYGVPCSHLELNEHLLSLKLVAPYGVAWEDRDTLS